MTTTKPGRAIVAERLALAPRIEMVPWRKAHYYLVEGHPNPDGPKGMWPSVTTVLNAGTPKPALVGWAKKQALEAVGATLQDYETLYGELPRSLTAVLPMLDLASKREDTEALDYGTAAHELIELWLKDQRLSIGSEKLGYESYTAFRDWLQQSGQEVAASELPVFHEGIAGTVDLLLYDGFGTWTVCDIKTGNGVYSDYAFQAAAYARAVTGMLDIHVQRATVLHLPKTPKDGEPPFSVHQIKDISAAFAGYKAAEAMRYVLSLKHFESEAKE